MEARSSVLELLLGALEQYLGQPHLVLAQEGDDVADALLAAEPARSVITLPPDVGWTPDALVPLTANLTQGQPLLVSPSWEVKRRTAGVSALAAAIGSVLTTFPAHPTSVLVPASILCSRRSRDREAAFLAQPFVIVGLEGLGHALGVHARFAFGLVHFQPEVEVTKFFKATGPVTADDVADDFRHLLQLRGGESRYGFVRRPAVTVEQPLWPDFWSPLLARKLDDVEVVGSTAPVQEFADVMVLTHRVADAHRRGDSGSTPCLTGRNISIHGEIDLDEALLAEVDDHQRLQVGDILLRAIQNLQRGPLVTAIVEEGHLPATADHTVLVVRPTPGLDPLQVEFLVSYLRSATAQAVLRARASGPHVRVADLSELPVPIPDEATKAAIGQLRDVRAQLEGWIEEADAAVDELLTFTGQGTAQARTRLFAVSSTSQRRAAAAALADDPAWQARTLYPHPISFCVRTAEASRPDMEGYRECIRCAEMILAYVALSIVAVLQADESLRLPYLDVLSDRQRERREVRLSMGDYLQIIRQFSGRQSRDFARLERWIPMEEIRENYTDDVDRATASLKERRDSQAHFRDDIDHEQAHQDVWTELGTLVGSLRFLTGYSLRLIENVRVDTFTRTTTYDYRELTGDHPLVPLQRGERYKGTIEPGSLYLKDLRGHMHLLRPFMLRVTCPTCGRPATFHLDMFGAGTAQYRSFEHGHTLGGEDQLPALRAVGLVP